MKKIIISKKYLKKAKYEGAVYTPELEDTFIDEDRGRLRRQLKPKNRVNTQLTQNEWIRLIEDQEKSESDNLDRLDSIFNEKLKKLQSSNKSIIICKK